MGKIDDDMAEVVSWIKRNSGGGRVEISFALTPRMSEGDLIRAMNRLAERKEIYSNNMKLTYIGGR